MRVDHGTWSHDGIDENCIACRDRIGNVEIPLADITFAYEGITFVFVIAERKYDTAAIPRHATT